MYLPSVLSREKCEEALLGRRPSTSCGRPPRTRRSECQRSPTPLKVSTSPWSGAAAPRRGQLRTDAAPLSPPTATRRVAPRRSCRRRRGSGQEPPSKAARPITPTPRRIGTPVDRGPGRLGIPHVGISHVGISHIGISHRRHITLRHHHVTSVFLTSAFLMSAFLTSAFIINDETFPRRRGVAAPNRPKPANHVLAPHHRRRRISRGRRANSGLSRPHLTFSPLSLGLYHLMVGVDNCC